VGAGSMVDSGGGTETTLSSPARPQASRKRATRMIANILFTFPPPFFLVFSISIINQKFYFCQVLKII
jgi:hypothetical protein